VDFKLIADSPKAPKSQRPPKEGSATPTIRNRAEKQLDLERYFKAELGLDFGWVMLS
jgi:hypothetical protein